MEMLKNTYYGLKGWQWIAVIGMAGFVFYRLHSAGSSSATSATDPNADTQGDPTAGAQGFTSGYAQGYAQGNYQGQIAPSATPSVPAGSKNCRTVKDPSGKPHLVCGNGAFENLMRPGQTPVWRWVEGLPHTVFAMGAKGNLFLHRPPATKARNGNGNGTGGGASIKNPGGTKKPIKLQGGNPPRKQVA